MGLCPVLMSFLEYELLELRYGVPSLEPLTIQQQIRFPLNKGITVPPDALTLYESPYRRIPHPKKPKRPWTLVCLSRLDGSPKSQSVTK
jgi:hypothetical protein